MPRRVLVDEPEPRLASSICLFRNFQVVCYEVAKRWHKDVLLHKYRVSVNTLMELPEIVKEKLIELDEENNQLRAELKRCQAKLASKDEIANELEEENIQLRNRLKTQPQENSRNPILERTVADLNSQLEEKTRECTHLSKRVEELMTSLQSANTEIDELRRSATPIDADESLKVMTHSIDLVRIQEERDDAVFELQRATIRISALEAERNDLEERAEAAATEARDLGRHLKELREQMHIMESELAASRNAVGVAQRGNSMFAEFAEERLKLEADLKTLFAKYETVRKENYMLVNELDEARLLALRRRRTEGTQRCRCQEVSSELVELRGRVRTLDDRLAAARNDLITIARKNGSDPQLKAYYRCLKFEMESLRHERNKLRDERDRLVDENACLSARAVNAEKLVEYANDDLETLKLQLAMLKEREQQQDADKVAELINGNGGEGDTKPTVSALFAPKSTPQPVTRSKSLLKQAVSETKLPPRTPFGDRTVESFDNPVKAQSEVRLKRLRFADIDANEQEEDSMRRESISASELRRLARKQARKGGSKLLPIAEPIMRLTAKINTTTTEAQNRLSVKVDNELHNVPTNLTASSSSSSVAKKLPFDSVAGNI
ncbi:unnamed protein product [Nippostrongylus brasiliensis]|uniref:HOOK domain-containing protein n=1 Tax=Nippostrongylus brasiliensis TaxID=27835 RepID=A0A0N4YG41_NIPBR|nr:unnamed protein product [Nippostrongylus brasiliensis]